MRIISGTHKGRRLTAPKNLPVRPTTDRSKEALFNILENTFDFENVSVLDLFSGTGNISYEFASRGVQQIAAVDQHLACIKFIKQTNDLLNLPIQTFKNDVFKFLEHTSLQADVIFADPPYDFPEEKFVKIVELVFEKSLLKEEGVLVIEHSKHTDLEKTIGWFEARKYGANVFSFFKQLD